MSSSAPNKLNTVIDKYAAEMSAKEAESRMRAVCVSPCDSAPLVWRMEDVAAVRSLGLVGALLGSLPRTPRQNVRMGRPLLLLPVEERLLDRHRATAEAAITQADAGQQVTLFQETLRRSYEEQRVLALRDRKLAMVRALGSSDPVFHSDEVENVTKTQRVAVTHLTRSEGDGEDGRRRRLEALERNFSFPRSAMTVQLSTARAGLAHLLAGGEGAGPTYGTDGHALRRPADPRRDARRASSLPRTLHRRVRARRRARVAVGPSRRGPSGFQRQEDRPLVLAARRRRDVLIAPVERDDLIGRRRDPYFPGAGLRPPQRQCTSPGGRC
ncbi:tRNA-splicing endonuclease subunit Sen34 isoform X3 [Phycodurus eques]|uniref:tRNA-splicing endonuclease subunit Sen34 isoform X3 n=1 Tax=Phycodurus eques TaxID=693459 RepID=UPI002ACDD276|nr:tRNA-splicing endonuclease subunit Sen34 isoform X3 [Phycodurus eques]XP_061538645.1 tRNA-splicing endonuclease subunit Sen34 isoform X3 [Phycodurus eques]